MRLFISFTLVATAAAQVNLQDLIGNMSPQCQATAASLMTSEFGTCANLMGLINILGATGSLLTPVNSWVQTVCSTAPCSASAVSTAAATVHGGCDTDIQHAVPSAVDISILVTNYAAIRKAICLENKSNHTRCATDLLANTEKVSGRSLTVPEIAGFLSGGLNSLGPALSKAPKESFCNDCTHALTTVLTPAASMAMNPSMASMPSMPMNSTSASNMATGVSSACGASFTDGKIPDSITVNIGSSTTNSNSNSTQNPANGSAASSGNLVSIPVYVSLAIVGLATAFATLF